MGCETRSRPTEWAGYAPSKSWGSDRPRPDDRGVRSEDGMGLGWMTSPQLEMLEKDLGSEHGMKLV